MDHTHTHPSTVELAVEKAQHEAQPVLSWTAPSQPHFERSQRWYAIGGAVVLLFAIYGIITGNWSLSIVSILVGGMYYMIRNAHPILHQISIDADGFSYDGVYSHWEECRDFWLIKTPVYSELHIWRKETSPHDVCIQTGHIDDKRIVALLSRKLTFRTDRKERLVDIFIRLCKL